MKKAFTLAEILITLSIIGVIASMTIPSLVQDIQDAQFKAGWKHTFSILDQATRRITQTNAGTLKGLCGSADDNCLRNLYLPYFNYIKTCNTSATLGKCWHYSYNDTKYLNGTKTEQGWYSSWSQHAGIVLNNGAFIIFRQHSCTNSDCGWITADLNGFKGPNTFGKDIFFAWLSNYTIKPFGLQGDTWRSMGETCIQGNSAITNTGRVCSAEYLYK